MITQRLLFLILTLWLVSLASSYEKSINFFRKTYRTYGGRGRISVMMAIPPLTSSFPQPDDPLTEEDLAPFEKKPKYFPDNAAYGGQKAGLDPNHPKTPKRVDIPHTGHSFYEVPFQMRWPRSRPAYMGVLATLEELGLLLPREVLKDSSHDDENKARRRGPREAPVYSPRLVDKLLHEEEEIDHEGNVEYQLEHGSKTMIQTVQDDLITKRSTYEGGNKLLKELVVDRRLGIQKQKDHYLFKEEQFDYDVKVEEDWEELFDKALNVVCLHQPDYLG